MILFRNLVKVVKGEGLLAFTLILRYRVRSNLTRMTDYIELIVVKVIRKGQPNLLLASIS